jgi:hypothetical protein
MSVEPSKLNFDDDDDSMTVVHRPRCWTNYMPHYNPEYQLDKLIVGSHDGWKYKMKSQGYPAKWGYLDFRPSYDVSSIKISTD